MILNKYRQSCGPWYSFRENKLVISILENEEDLKGGGQI